MRNVLHHAAPSAVVNLWATAKGDRDDKGHPTYRAKVRWLLRHEPNDVYRSALVEDIDSALRLVSVLSAAIHEDSSEPCERDADWLGIRIERALEEILKRYRAGAN